MADSDFEGSLVLEQLATIGEVDSFLDAVDSDDAERASQLMKRAGVDPPDIATVLEKMANGDDD